MHLGTWREIVALAVAWVAMTPKAAMAGPECAVETRLQWIDVLAVAPFAYRAMADEAAAMLARHGVCAAIVPAAASAVRTRDEIGVVLLRSMGAAGAGQRVMGAVRHTANGTASVWVYFDEVASALGLGGRDPAVWTAVERSDFARALGRVTAHEVLHALLPGRPHDPSGLMAASLSRTALTRLSLSGDRELLAAVRRATPSGTHANRSWALAR